MKKINFSRGIINCISNTKNC